MFFFVSFSKLLTKKASHQTRHGQGNVWHYFIQCSRFTNDFTAMSDMEREMCLIRFLEWCLSSDCLDREMCKWTCDFSGNWRSWRNLQENNENTRAKKKLEVKMRIWWIVLTCVRYCHEWHGEGNVSNPIFRMVFKSRLPRQGNVWVIK